MKRIDPVALGVIIITVMIIGGIFLAASNSGKAPVTQYNPKDADRPKIEIGQTDFEFGKMKLDDVKTQDVPIKNTGTQPLILSNILTSCNCTFAQVEIDGKLSPRFSMHENPDWRGIIEPNGQATMKITYEPSIMPVKGGVKREIVFKTNDPDRPLINLRLTATVE